VLCTVLHPGLGVGGRRLPTIVMRQFGMLLASRRMCTQGVSMLLPGYGYLPWEAGLGSTVTYLLREMYLV